MSFHSSHSQDNNEMADEEEAQGQPSADGKRRAPNQRSRSNAPPKQRKPRKPTAKRSEVWQHFTENKDDPEVANCKYCGTGIGCDSVSVGTTPMRNHYTNCNLYKAFMASGTQKILVGDSSGVTTAIQFDKVVFRRSVNEMIVLNELPFSFVESEGFRRFCNNVIPMYQVHCRKTATTDIFSMYLQQKAALKMMFSCNKQRVSLTTDIWVAPTTAVSYMVITCHWIDVNWEMQKRIINLKPVLDHTGDTIASHLMDCLEEWGIHKVSTLTVDNARGNDKALRTVTEAMMLKGPNALIRGGAYLHMRCCAHIMNLIVKDGLAHVRESITAIRNAVKYVRSSWQRLQSFQLRVETGKVTKGSLTLDVKTRWNSTYLMLTAAIKLRVGFQKMMDEDKPYNEYFLENETEDNGEKRIGPPQKRVGPPTSDSWDEVQRLVKFLKIFFKSTLAFSASKTVTSTICYNEIVAIESSLISLSFHNDEKLKSEATSMRTKFVKYWDGLLNMNPLVIIASMFDPRNKKEFAFLCFDKLYGKDSLESNHLRISIIAVMKEIYEEYVLMLKPTESSGTKSTQLESQQASAFLDLSDDDEGFDAMDDVYTELNNTTAEQTINSELDIYLLEPRVPRSKNDLGLTYDVLSWWKQNSPKYPILSEMARDVLAIQVSSVASESAFSTSGRILDPFRSCLTPYMVEALICLQQWLRNSIQAEKLASMTEMLAEIDFHESLDSRKQSQP